MSNQVTVPVLKARLQRIKQKLERWVAESRKVHIRAEALKDALSEINHLIVFIEVCAKPEPPPNIEMRTGIKAPQSKQKS